MTFSDGNAIRESISSPKVQDIAALLKSKEVKDSAFSFCFPKSQVTSSLETNEGTAHTQLASNVIISPSQSLTHIVFQSWPLGKRQMLATAVQGR
nr:hypothetical protein CFP56_27594 [Quercus suber]POE58886.1 hypothetical protein CFP56_01666 [Quercus suber]POE58887.1 hypothetical protein CFP56_01667 [Quercus suber]